MANKRRILLVDQRVQWAIIRQSLLHWMCFAMSTVALLFLLQLLSSAGAPKSWSEHWRAILSISAAVAATFLLLFPMFIYDSLKQSNRFVGPLMRLRRSLRELAEGKPYQPLVFRENDFWAEMANDLGRAVAQLSKDQQPSKHGEAETHGTEQQNEAKAGLESSKV
ncbi:MAG: hypothetical protein K8T25_24740 [Planctomycetia bacterium]|nr:hypothetical protein [Planctomycetia bacterium]